MKTNTSQGLALVTSNGDDDDRHDQTVKSESFSENQHQNHTHENLLLLTASAHAYVSLFTRGLYQHLQQYQWTDRQPSKTDRS